MFCEYLILFHPHHFRLHVYTAILQRLKNRGKRKATMPTNDSRRDLGSPHIKGMNSFTFRQLLQVIIVIAVNNIFNSWQMKCEKFRCRSSSLSACSTEPIYKLQHECHGDFLGNHMPSMKSNQWLQINYSTQQNCADFYLRPRDEEIRFSIGNQTAWKKLESRWCEKSGGSWWCGCDDDNNQMRQIHFVFFFWLYQNFFSWPCS